MIAHRTTALLLLLGACATWQPYDAPGTLQPNQNLPYQIRATRADSSRVALTSPFLKADSLFGRERGDTIGLPLADITQLERSRTSLWRTAVTLIAVPAVGLALAYVIVCGSGCEADYAAPPP